ncbi:MAG: adenosylcobinamide-phosphate synthase CbiB [Calothrix sp. MO_167.B42]|nr:adenosylcobinamide-phosphate synthase CbiB [Calothrix sp. MO_167.B42]
MFFDEQLIMASYGVIILAAALDYLIGDPINMTHPVQIMGWVISFLGKLAVKYCHYPVTQRLAGVFLGTILVVGSGAIAQLIVYIAQFGHPFLGIVTQTILLASCFAGKSLRNAATAVLQPLEQGDLSIARSTLSNYVGRDTENLTAPEILRAILETVTENATDGVMAPLFYAILGALLPGVEPVTLAMAYKASSTLDSMIGYKHAPYTYLGWFSARSEDILTWLPCRLHVITLGIIASKPLEVWQMCRRDAIKDPSPNSGWSECSYAAILAVQVGGVNWYRGMEKHKPLLGDPIVPITSQSIYQALQLTRYSFLLWLGVAALLLIVLNK